MLADKPCYIDCTQHPVLNKFFNCKLPDMKFLLLFILSLWLLSCKKTDPGPSKRLERRIEVYNDTASLTTVFEYDAQGRIVTIKTASNNKPLQLYITVSYSGNEATMQFQPFNDGFFNVTRQMHLLLNADGKLLQRSFLVKKNDPSDPSYYQESLSSLDLNYDAAGYLKTATYYRLDSSWRPGSRWTSRDSFITQYSTIEGKLTNADQTGGTSYTLDTDTGYYKTNRIKEYHTVFSYTKLQPNDFDCSNAAILNQIIGFNLSDQYYDVNEFEPIVDAGYRYMPDRTQKRALEKDENGNTAVGFNADVQLNRTYNKDGMLEKTEVLTPYQGMKRIEYYYIR